MAPPFGHQEANLWTPEEVERLFDLRTAHTELSWREFHAKNFFPQRTKVSLSSQRCRMGQTRELPFVGHYHRRLNAIATGKRGISNAGIEAGDDRGSCSKDREAAVHNGNKRAQQRKRRRSIWSIESSSDSDAEDIDYHGYTGGRPRTTAPQASLRDKGAGESSSQPPDIVRASQQSSFRTSRRSSKLISPKRTIQSFTPALESSGVSNREMENFKKYPYRTLPEIRAIRAKAGRGTTTSEMRAQPSQTQKPASSTCSQPTVSAVPDSHTHNYEPFAGSSNAPHTAQRSTSCSAHTLVTEVSPNAEVDFMALVPMPQPGSSPALSQRATSVTPIESVGEAEGQGTATTTNKRIETLDRSRVPKMDADDQKGRKDAPSTMAQESQDSVA
ncbi:hypothetical protein BJX65DRAFT_311067 [Aspergillus insuetus]